MAKAPYDPQTPDEWQEAADAAEFTLMLDAARQYGLIEYRDQGLVTTAPEVDYERCTDLLARAGAMGVTPRPLPAILDGR